MEKLSGAAVAAAIKKELRERLSLWQGERPALAIVRVGEREADLSYERSAKKCMAAVGIEVLSFVFPDDISMEEFLPAFAQINGDPRIDGILLFRPLPSQLEERVILERMDPAKDVDGITLANMARIFLGDRTGFAPCTAEAVIELLKFYQIPLEGRRAVVAGRSLVVGKPLSMLLLQENCTVTVCHSRTRDMQKSCRQADILVAAVGRPRLMDGSYVAKDAVVIDVGINVDESGRLCGDVDYAALEGIARAATPVPGGVGAVTSSVLAKHVVRAAIQRRGA